MLNSYNEKRDDDEKWLAREYWEEPSWLNKSKGIAIDDFNSYYTRQLRARYVDLESDFRSSFSEFGDECMDFAAARVIAERLSEAKKLLDHDGTNNHLTIASLLDTVDRYLIWVFPYDLVAKRVFALSKVVKNEFPEESKMLSDTYEGSRINSMDSIRDLRGTYDEVKQIINRFRLENHINIYLQLKRLKMLRLIGVILFIVTLWISKQLINTGSIFMSTQVVEPQYIFTQEIIITSDWIKLISIAIIGSLGAFISGLMQIRSSKVSLLDYQESIKKFHLRLIIGGLMGLLTTVFLSWEILDISINGFGMYILIAFLSGFSERYFLKMLKLDNEKDADSTETTTSIKATESVASTIEKTEKTNHQPA